MHNTLSIPQIGNTVFTPTDAHKRLVKLMAKTVLDNIHKNFPGKTGVIINSTGAGSPAPFKKKWNHK